MKLTIKATTLVREYTEHRLLYRIPLDPKFYKSVNADLRVAILNKSILWIRDSDGVVYFIDPAPFVKISVVFEDAPAVEEN